MVTKREQEYLDEVCSYVKWKQVHGAIRAELAAHMEDIRETLKGEGIAEDEASRRAAEEMGSSELVGRQMNRAYRPRIPQMALWMLGLLVAAGVAMRLSMGESDLRAALTLFLGLGVFLLEIRYWDMNRFLYHGRKILIGYGIFLFVMLILLCSWETCWVLDELNIVTYLNSAVICATMIQPTLLILCLEKLRGKGILGLFSAGAFCVLTLIPVAYLPHVATAGLIALVDLVLITYAILNGIFGTRRWALLAILGGATILLIFLAVQWTGSYRWGRLLGASDTYQMIRAREMLQYCNFFGAAEFPQDTSFWAGVGGNEYLLVDLAAKWGTWIFAAVGLVFAGLSGLLIQWSFRQKKREILLICLAVVGTMMVQVVLFFLISFSVIGAMDLYLPFISSANFLQLTNFILMGILYASAGNAWMDNQRNMVKTA